MAGLKQPAVQLFWRRLHARGYTRADLARAIDTSPAYVSRIVGGEQRNGAQYQNLCAWLRVRGFVELIRLLEQVKPTSLMFHENPRPEREVSA